MLLNKSKRLKYLGFDDIRFTIIGILVLSFATDYIFSNSFVRFPLGEALFNWSVSLFFSTCDWFIIRAILIRLRMKYPDLKDNIQRITLFFLGIVATVVIVDFLGIQLISNFVEGVNYNFVERSRALLSIIIISTMTMAIYEAIYFYVRLKKSIREEEQSKQAVVQAQLDGLRNQAQPHFFFNTLNTLRDIIDQNDREDAKKFVDKLSEIYRFLLESGNANLISLKDEIKFAKAYLHIQKERFGDNLILHWGISEAATQKLIVPMSLQLLLENAIKHNVVSKTRPLEITIQTSGDQLFVENEIRKKSTKLPSTKMGLKNIEKRYTLISHKSIEIIDDGKRFRVVLPLIASEEKGNGQKIS